VKNNAEILNCSDMIYHGGSLFKLSLLCKQTWQQGKVFSFPFFLFWFGRGQVFIARAVCELNVTVAALCTSFAPVYQACASF